MNFVGWLVYYFSLLQSVVVVVGSHYVWFDYSDGLCPVIGWVGWPNCLGCVGRLNHHRSSVWLFCSGIPLSARLAMVWGHLGRRLSLTVGSANQLGVLAVVTLIMSMRAMGPWPPHFTQWSKEHILIVATSLCYSSPQQQGCGEMKLCGGDATHLTLIDIDHPSSGDGQNNDHYQPAILT